MNILFFKVVVTYISLLFLFSEKAKAEEQHLFEEVAQQVKVVHPEYLVVENNHFPQQLFTWNVLFPQKPEFKMGFYVSPSFQHEFGFYLEGDSLFWARAVGPYNIYMQYSHEGEENASRYKKFDAVEKKENIFESDYQVGSIVYPPINEWVQWSRLMSGRNYSEKYVQRGEIKLGNKRAEEFKKIWDLVIAQSLSLSPEYQEIFGGMDGRALYYADSQGNVSKDKFFPSFPMRSHLEAFCRIVADMGLLHDSSEEAMERMDCGLSQLRADAHRLRMKKIWLPGLPPGLWEGEYPFRERDVIVDPKGRDASDMENEGTWKDWDMAVDIQPEDVLMKHLEGNKGIYHSFFPGQRRGSPGLIMVVGSDEKRGVILIGNLLVSAESRFYSWVPSPYEYTPTIGCEESTAVVRSGIVLPDEIVKGLNELIKLLSGKCVTTTKNGESYSAMVAFQSDPVSPREAILLPNDKIFQFIEEMFQCATSPYMGKEGVEPLIPLMETALKEAREVGKSCDDAPRR